MSMTVEHLRNKLDANKVPKYWYRILPEGYWKQGSAGLMDEKYILSFENEKWCVYYSERGQKSDCHEFSSESEACDYFYWHLFHANTKEKERLNVECVDSWEKVW